MFIMGIAWCGSFISWFMLSFKILVGYNAIILNWLNHIFLLVFSFFLVENRYNIRNCIMNVINNYMHHATRQKFQVVNFLSFEMVNTIGVNFSTNFPFLYFLLFRVMIILGLWHLKIFYRYKKKEIMIMIMICDD